jgi:hypothetical protein
VRAEELRSASRLQFLKKVALGIKTIAEKPR